MPAVALPRFSRAVLGELAARGPRERRADRRLLAEQLSEAFPVSNYEADHELRNATRELQFALRRELGLVHLPETMPEGEEVAVRVIDQRWADPDKYYVGWGTDGVWENNGERDVPYSQIREWRLPAHRDSERATNRMWIPEYEERVEPDRTQPPTLARWWHGREYRAQSQRSREELEAITAHLKLWRQVFGMPRHALFPHLGYPRPAQAD